MRNRVILSFLFILLGTGILHAQDTTKPVTDTMYLDGKSGKAGATNKGIDIVDTFKKNGVIYYVTSDLSDTFDASGNKYIVRSVVQPEMHAISSNGKIYIVVLVLATIFAGIIGFLTYLDRRITKIEKNKHS